MRGAVAGACLAVWPDATGLCSLALPCVSRLWCGFHRCLVPGTQALQASASQGAAGPPHRFLAGWCHDCGTPTEATATVDDALGAVAGLAAGSLRMPGQVVSGGSWEDAAEACTRLGTPESVFPLSTQQVGRRTGRRAGRQTGSGELVAMPLQIPCGLLGSAPPVHALNAPL